MINKNDEFELEITGCTSDGGGVGKKDGMAVFVENTAVGDVVLCHIIKAKKNYAVGKALKVLKPSKDRINSPCDLFSTCGGCSFCHIKYEAELKLKEEKVKDAFKRIGHITPEFESIIASPREYRYRNKAQYPVRRENGQLKIGFYAKKSHRVTDCGECLLQPEKFTEIVETVRHWVQKFGVGVYSEETNCGLLRHIFLRLAEKTGEIAVCLVINGDSIPKKDELLDALLKIEGFKTLVLNVNKKASDTVLGKEMINIYGDGYITDELCGVKVRISPLSFYQVNRSGAELLYKKAAEYAGLSGNETVLDLYCGTGTIGLSMAKSAKTLIGAEIVADAVKDARLNAEENGILNAEFICADAYEAAKELESRGITPDTVILDPPRKGCAEELLKTVADMSPKKIVYVSCDPATLARDCERLLTLGYKPEKATPVDMFPKTAHVETVVQLVRKKPDAYIDITVDMDELDLTSSEAKATYD